MNPPVRAQLLVCYYFRNSTEISPSDETQSHARGCR